MRVGCDELKTNEVTNGVANRASSGLWKVLWQNPAFYGSKQVCIEISTLRRGQQRNPEVQGRP
jgi:hypothetical protein